MKKLFGTDGMRGAAGRFPLDEQTVFAVGQSLARQFREKTNRAPRFVIGRDTRESGDWIKAAFCAGAIGETAEIINAGIITTPGVAFLAKHENQDAGIVISASHNPFDDNGIKIFAASGRKLDETTERQIEADIFNDELQITNHESAITDADAPKLQQIYLDYLLGEFADLDLSGLKLVLDCANGAAFELAPRLFASLGANVTAIFNEPDGRNINENCGSLHLENLQRAVVAAKADFGAAFDGDADRALFVDANGQIVDGDGILWVMAKFLQHRNRLESDLVVATVMSNLGLELALKSRNIELRRANVGDKYVLAELLETNAAIGGEQSGHIIFPRRSLVGDGMLTALNVLAAMRESDQSLSELGDGFARYPQILVNVKVREKRAFDEVPNIAQAAREIERELGERGRLLLRYSGTESLARVMIEGERQDVINEQAKRLAAVIERELN